MVLFGTCGREELELELELEFAMEQNRHLYEVCLL